MRRQLPNDQRLFRIFRDTEQEFAREQAKLRFDRQDQEISEDTIQDNATLPPEDATGKIADPPASFEPDSAAGYFPEPGPKVPVPAHNSLSAPDWPLGQDETDPEQMKLETPTGMAFFGELATAYVPWQTFSQTLDLREALRVGTLFPELIRTPPLYKRPGS